MTARRPVAPETVEACARGLLAREHARRRAATERAGRLRDSARRAAEALGREHGATRVWLFGSLAWGEPHEATDVDLLVEGLRPSRLSAAAETVERLVPAAVDVVRLEEAAPGLAARVRAEGVLLHDAG